MLKVLIISVCTHCNSNAYLRIEEADDHKGHKKIYCVPYPIFEGGSIEPYWVSLKDLSQLTQDIS